MAAAGFTECLTMALVSREENYGALMRADDGAAVALANPKSEEFQIVRTSLIPGLLKSLEANKSMPFGEGVRLFEVSDVVLPDASSDVGARNVRRLCAAYTGPTSGFEIIHGLLDRVMHLLEVRLNPEVAVVALMGTPDGDAATADLAVMRGTGDAGAGGGFDGLQYTVEPHDVPPYFAGRSARVVLQQLRGGRVTRTLPSPGHFGVIHPAVLKRFDLDFPVSVLELDLRPFL
jgi:phenylalanyl-tRNA synthetase beta chain